MVGLHLLLAAFALVQIARYGRGALRFLGSLKQGRGPLRRGNVLPFAITVFSLVVLATALGMVLRGAGR
jgi:hypothetical protein